MAQELAFLGVTDWVLLGVLLVSVLIGVWRGLVFELASLAGWILAWWVAQQFADPVGRALPLTENTAPALRHLAGFGAAFLATLLMSALAARLMRMAIAFTPLTVPDRVLGACFGLLRGLLVLLILSVAIQWTPVRHAAWWQASQVVQWLHAVQQGVQPLLPSILRGPERA